MPDDEGATGQEPNAQPQEGTQPSGQEPSVPTSGLTHEQALAALEAARREAASYRKAKADAEAALKAKQDAELTELQRAQQERDEAAKERDALKQERIADRRDRAIEKAARAANFVDPEDAAYLLRSKPELIKDDEPDTKAIEAAVKALAESKPHLVGKQGPQPTTTSATNGATNGRGGAPDMNSLLRAAAGR